LTQAIVGGGEDDFEDMASVIKMFRVKLWQIDLQYTNVKFNFLVVEV